VEADLRVLLDIEEVGRGEMRIALLVTGADARYIDDAMEDRGITGGIEGALKPPKLAANGRDAAHVTDGKANRRMTRVHRVRPRGNLAGRGVRC
jgi:hypothetical protein